MPNYVGTGVVCYTNETVDSDSTDTNPATFLIRYRSSHEKHFLGRIDGPVLFLVFLFNGC